MESSETQYDLYITEDGGKSWSRSRVYCQKDLCDFSWEGKQVAESVTDMSRWQLKKLPDPFIRGLQDQSDKWQVSRQLKPGMNWEQIIVIPSQIKIIEPQSK